MQKLFDLDVSNSSTSLYISKDISKLHNIKLIDYINCQDGVITLTPINNNIVYSIPFLVLENCCVELYDEFANKCQVQSFIKSSDPQEFYICTIDAQEIIKQEIIYELDAFTSSGRKTMKRLRFKFILNDKKEVS